MLSLKIQEILRKSGTGKKMIIKIMLIVAGAKNINYNKLLSFDIKIKTNFQLHRYLVEYIFLLWIFFWLLTIL